jgi:hypothetical protein
MRAAALDGGGFSQAWNKTGKHFKIPESVSSRLKHHPASPVWWHREEGLRLFGAWSVMWPAIFTNFLNNICN